MNKKLIAGASSAVLAAMPVLGVFATQGDGNLVDTIKVGISESCSISRVAVDVENNKAPHTAGTGDNAGTWGANGQGADTLSGSIANGGVANNYGSSTFNVICNHSTGYAVNAVATALNNATSTASIPLNASFDATHSGWAYKVSTKEDSMKVYKPAATAGEFDEVVTPASTWLDDATNAKLVAGTAPINNGEFTVTYGVGIDATQQADNYSGTITYTIYTAD